MSERADLSAPGPVPWKLVDDRAGRPEANDVPAWTPYAPRAVVWGIGRTYAPSEAGNGTPLAGVSGAR